MIRTIIAVDAVDLPDEVIDYCIEELDISTHYQNDIARIENDGNPFAKWLISNGYVFTKDYCSVGIFAT
ncbi:MAG: hypothetical protein WC503_06065 [Candidatus Shapirobacteria bacterium]